MADFDNTNRGVLFTNDRKQGEKHPDYKGSINVGGKEFWLSAWSKSGAKGPFLSLSIEAKDAQSGESKPAATPTQNSTQANKKPSSTFADMDDDLPF